MAKSKASSEDADILEEAKKRYDRAVDYESDNRELATDDIKFGRLEEQWPAEILLQRQNDERPCLTIPVLGPIIRQVVNDARQNKPAIQVTPVDSSSDIETADIFSDLIRNIEQQSNADHAYDTGVDYAVSGGFGYWRVGIDYPHDGTFDKEITIDRILNPFSVFGDPDSTAADSSDWNCAFVVDRIPKEQFEKDFGDAGQVDWDASGYSDLGDAWLNEDGVLVAEYWMREEIEKPIFLLQRGENETQVVDKEFLDADFDESGVTNQQFMESLGWKIVNKRNAKSWKVTQRRMTGAELLPFPAEGDEEATTSRPWAGKWIPIIPCYGEEVVSENKRYFKSLIRSAKDAQRSLNYWRSAATELVALAPRVPFIGPKGFAASDPNWSRANKASIPYLEYDMVPGMIAPPQRQPLDVGAAAGALQEAANASEDIKRITGIFDASLGAPSNETSGKAIIARQKEGDVSTFHFIDNLNRSIAHTGRILVDLIPKIYGTRQILRVVGEDGKHRMMTMGQPVPVNGPDGKPVMQPAPPGSDGRPPMQQGPNGLEPVMVQMTRINDLQVGRYDVNLKSGPSYTSRREEAATQLTEAMRSVPQAAPILLVEIFKNLDLPGADDIAQKLEALAPKPNNGPPPEMQKMMQQAEEKFKALTAERDQLQQQLKAAGDKSQQSQIDTAVKAAQIKVDAANSRIAAFKAETERFTAITSSHLDYAKVGLDAQLEMADLNLAHAELIQSMQQGGAQPGQGAPMGAGQPQMPPQPVPQPMPMQRPQMNGPMSPQGGPPQMPQGQ